MYCQLVSSKQLTTFSDFRHAGKEDFLSAESYVQYLESYRTKFGLRPYIRLNTQVVAVKRYQEGTAYMYTVFYSTINTEVQEAWQCDAVAVCSGLHTEPNIPRIKGVERVPEVIHSSEFKCREQFGFGKTVMILGTGETGADIAYLAVTSPTSRVIMCHRDGFHFAPKVSHLLSVGSCYLLPSRLSFQLD